MMVFRRIAFLFLALAVASFGYGASVRASGPSVYVNEVEVIRLSGGTAGDRAQHVAAALVSAGSGAVSIAPAEGGSFRLYVSTVPVLTVTAEDGKARSSNPKAIAAAWAGALQRAFALPGVKFPIDGQKLPLGSTRAFAMVGSQVADAVAVSTNDKVIKVTRNGASINVQAVGVGRAKVRSSAGNSSATLDIQVQPMAAYFPQTVTATVTGAPSSPENVAGAIEGAVNAQVRAVPGATVTISKIVAGTVATGENRAFTVRVRVSGPEAYPNEGLVQVVLKNAPIGYRSETELWYCNHPENIRKPMNVFSAALKVGAPARMLYHHINKAGTTLIMHVEAVNNTNTVARVLIIPGDAEPSSNPVRAGFDAGDRFVTNWQSYSGEVVEIPPYSILPISLRRMGKNETVSGLCYLRLLEGGPDQIVVRTQAVLPSFMAPKWKAALASSTPWRVAGVKPVGDLAAIAAPDTEHIYPKPFKDEEVAYTVGGPYSFVRIGQSPIARQDNQGALDGNFGVIYTIKANLENPTNLPADVEVVYEASAGYGGALFLIGKNIRKTPLLRAKEETRLSLIHLEPNSSLQVRIMTVPLSGSSYPTTITIRPAQAAVKLAAKGGARQKR